MADTPVTKARIAGALAELFDDQIASQINRSVVLLQLLPFALASGQVLVWDAEFGAESPTTPTLADGATVVDFNDDDIVKAKLDFGTYSEAFSITGKARAAALASGNPRELADLFGEKIERAIRRQAKSLGKDLYSGTGGDALVGLLSTNGPMDSVGTYASIDRGTYTQWAGNKLAGGGNPRALTLGLMRDAKRRTYEKSGEWPDLIVCDAFQQDKYGSLLGSERRYMQDVTMRGQKITLDGGFRALEFDGIPVIADVNCPAGTMLFLHTPALAVRQLPDGGAPWQGSAGAVDLHGTGEAQLGGSNAGAGGSVRLRSRINPLARVGDKYPFQLVCYPQIQCKRPQSQTQLIDLAIT